MKVARIYMRVSTDDQSLERQNRLIADAKASGFYVAGVYAESASGASANRPELLRMIDDLQTGEAVIAERMDRISRLPLSEAEKLIEAIKAKGAQLAIPGVVDLSDLVATSDGVARIVLESVQSMLLKVTLQIARDDYEDRRRRQAEGVQRAKQAGRYTGRKPDLKLHERIIALRSAGTEPKTVAHLLDCSLSTVKRVWKKEKEGQQQ